MMAGELFMSKSVKLILRYSITVLVWINFFALTVFAQEVTDNLDYTRVVCVEGVGCMYTHLRDEDLDTLFPDKERFIGIDQSLGGHWILNFDVTRECSNDPDIHTGTYEMQLGIYDQDETDEILIDTVEFYYERIFYKIGAGIYVGEVEIGDATTSGSSTYFLVKVEDDLLRGISFTSTHEYTEDVYCYSNSVINGTPFQYP